jgi:hypothetical protein
LCGKNGREEIQLLTQAKEKLFHQMDIVYLIKKLHETHLLKQIIFDINQKQLFEYLSENLENVSHQILRKKTSNFIDSYHKLKEEKSVININLLKLYDEQAKYL